MAARRYAAVASEAFGDLVGHWTTHNEPWVAAVLGHIDGVGRTHVNLANQTASVDYDPDRAEVADMLKAIRTLGAEARLRQAGGAPFVTDEGHWILDCPFGRIEDPTALAASLSTLAGIVEHGLFVGMAERVLLGGDEGIEQLVATP